MYISSIQRDFKYISDVPSSRDFTKTARGFDVIRSCLRYDCKKIYLFWVFVIMFNLEMDVLFSFVSLSHFVWYPSQFPLLSGPLTKGL